MVSISDHPRCTGLYLDDTGHNVLFTDSESIRTCNIQYAETICKQGMRLVVAQHAHPVMRICMDAASNYIASVDSSGLVLVTSNNTK